MGRGVGGPPLIHTCLGTAPVKMKLLLPLSVCVLALLAGQAESKPKGHCKPLQKAKYKIFKPFTKSKTGCPCWWDITKKTQCACCKGDTKKVMQCGFPMQNYCYKKSDRVGCPGVCNNKYTLSQRGYPCFWDHTRTDCAWCSDNGYQCGPGKATGPEAKDGSRCQTGKNKKYCDSVLGDCRHIPNCDFNAKCMFKRKFGKDTQIFECKCNPGYKGNGIKCRDKDGQLSVNPDTQVEVTMELKSDFYVYPHVDGDFPYGREMDGLFKQMENVACPTGKCQAMYNQTENNL